MVTQQQIVPPPNWPGSVPEYVAYQTFIELGLDPTQDFTYQSPQMGGRMDKGGFILDFMFTNPPDLAVNVQGEYYHYEFGVEAKARDVMQRASLAGQNITLIFIDVADLMSDSRYFCQEALNYRDHSQLGGG